MLRARRYFCGKTLKNEKQGDFCNKNGRNYTHYIGYDYSF